MCGYVNHGFKHDTKLYSVRASCEVGLISPKSQEPVQTRVGSARTTKSAGAAYLYDAMGSGAPCARKRTPALLVERARVGLPLLGGREGVKQGRGHGGSMPPRGRWTGHRGGILWFCHSALDLWKGMLWRNHLPLSRGTGAALQPWYP